MTRRHTLTALALALSALGCGNSHDHRRCDAGQWDHDDDAATLCVPFRDCAPGEYEASPGSDESDRQCAPCEAGTFSMSVNATACLDHRVCSAGEYVSAAPTGVADATCDACASGTYSSDSNASSCAAWTDCVAGQFVMTQGNAASDRVCAACPSGTATTGPNQSVCVLTGACEPGTVQTAPGTSTSPPTCEACVAGEYCPGGEAARGLCGVGDYDHDADPSTVCLAWTTCVAGQYVATSGTSTMDRQCDGCADDTYSNTENASSCLTSAGCEPGTVQVAPGNSTMPPTCSPCSVGEYCAGGVTPAVACDATSWDDDADPGTACEPRTECQPGEYVLADGSSTVDRMCDACEVGSFTDAPNLTACSLWSDCTAPYEEVSAPTGISDRACAPPFIIEQFGTVETDFGGGVDRDSSGNLYVAGDTEGVLAGTMNAGRFDAFLRKYNGAGELQWTRQFGTEDDDTAYSVAVAPDGSAHLTGATFMDLVIDGSQGGRDGYLRKYDSDGAEQWTVQFGTAEYDEPIDVALAADGSVFVIGLTFGDLAGTGVLGDSDVFVLKYDASGALDWAKQIGTSARDDAFSLCVTSDGALVVTGFTQGEFVAGTQFGSDDIFTVKYTLDGDELWRRQFGSAESDRAEAIAPGPSGTTYIAGSTLGDLTGVGALGSRDVFVHAYDADGVALWTRQFGSVSGEQAYRIRVGANGGVYIVGETSGDIVAPNAGMGDAFIRRYDIDGTESWTRLIGSVARDRAWGLHVAADGRIVVLGDTRGDLGGLGNAGRDDVFMAFLTDSL